MIVGLSYMGDIRMGLAEDSKKVERIASSSSAGLEETYLPLLEVGRSQHKACCLCSLAAAVALFQISQKQRRHVYNICMQDMFPLSVNHFEALTPLRQTKRDTHID